MTNSHGYTSQPVHLRHVVRANRLHCMGTLWCKNKAQPRHCAMSSTFALADRAPDALSMPRCDFARFISC